MKFKREGCDGRPFFFFMIALLFMGFSSFVAIPGASAQETLIPETGPINPDFVRFQEDLAVVGSQSLAVPAEGGLGLVPSPLDLSHLRGQAVIQTRALALGFSASYDLRSQGRVTPVRNQGNCGSCWAFATYGSLESNLLPAESDDFSENNLKNTHGFDWGPCAGGNGDISTAYLARWGGAISEAADPYDLSSVTSPPGLQPVKHTQDVLIIPGRANSLDNDNIKQAVMTHGGIYTTLYWSDSYYQSGNHAYYYNGSTQINHAVVIVGWDDNYPKGSFSSPPPGNGAFIIRNSWGPGWGEGGYFYLSYYDSKVGQDNYVFDSAEPVSDYSRVYQYDPLGWTGSLGYGSNTAWFSNIFSAAGNEQLTAVSFHTASVNSNYAIYVHTNVTSGPVSGLLAGSKTGTISFPGYHTVALSSPVPLTSGQRFSVVVKLTTPGYNYPIPMEYPYANYSSKATANAGESYISSDGASWSDITSSFQNTNVCLKAFTNSAPVTRRQGVDFDGDKKTDVSVYRTSTGTWYILPSSGASAYGVGWGGDPSDIPVPGDYDGDGKTDLAIYRKSTGAWFIYPSSSGVSGIYGVGFGGDASDIPVPGDYDGDGKTDIAIYRKSIGAWFIYPSSTGPLGVYGVGFGGDASDIPVPGDYDGDGKTDIAIYRKSIGAWFIYPSSTGPSGVYGVGFGGDASDIPVPGDYDGDGKTDIAIYRKSIGAWFVYPSSTGPSGIYGVGFGGDPTDIPVPGDYDGDGKTDIAIYRKSTGTWFIYPSSTGISGIYSVVWGGDPSDIPLP